MIKKLTIDQFQNHTHSELEFSEGLNVICGTSNSGKSAIIRALRLILENKPSGDSYRNWHAGKESTKVKIEFDSGDIVERIRGSKNIYVFNGEEYKAVGVNVPDEISNIFDINDINIQSQFAPHFLLSSSAGDVARKLNSIVGIEDIDRSNKRINKIISEVKMTIKYTEGEKTRLEEKHKEYLQYPGYEEALDGIENGYNKIKQLKDDQNRIQELITDVQKLNIKIFDLNNIIKYENSIDTLIKNSNELTSIKDTHFKLSKLINNLNNANDNLNTVESILEHESTIDNLILEKNKILTMANNNKSMRICIEKLKKVDYDLKKSKVDCHKIQIDFDNIMQELKLCPLCGNKI